MHADLIYDVGMNDGDDAAYYLSKGFRVLAIEADPVLAEEGTRRFASEIAAGRLTLLNVAVAAKPGSAQFWVSPTMRIWNSFDRNIAARGGREAIPIEVQCRHSATSSTSLGRRTTSRWTSRGTTGAASWT